MKRKKTLQEISYVVLLLAAIVVLFGWYTNQNRNRMEERNKNYAADSARLKVEQIDVELSNALSRISTYAYFLGEGLTEPEVTAQMLKEIEANSQFDVVIFTDINGMDLASEGQTADVTDRDFYKDGIN